MKIGGLNLCSPALIYLVFSLTQVVVDTIKGFYNVALLKFIMMFLFTLLLNILCERGLSVISWIIVFVPFVLMSVITSILLFVFGLDPSSGKIIPPQSVRSSPVPTVMIDHKKARTSNPDDIHRPTRITNTLEDRMEYLRKAIGDDYEGAKESIHKKTHHLSHTSVESHN